MTATDAAALHKRSIGANPSEWAAAYAKITVTAELNARTFDGHVYHMLNSQSRELGLSELFLDDTGTHKPRTRSGLGGGPNVKYPVFLIPDEEDGGFIAECPSLPGCMSEGDTEEEAIENIKEAIRGCVKVREELNMPSSVIVRYVEV